MAGFSDYSARAVLDWMTGKASMAAAGTRYIALFTAAGDDSGTGFTELSGNGYARAATAGTDWNSAGGSAPSTVSNANAISFPAATGTWSNIIAWAIYDAASGGNLIAWDYLGNYGWLEFSCAAASPGVLTAPAHGYNNGNSVVVDSEFGAGSLPPTDTSWNGLLTVASVTTDTFTAGVNATGSGSGMVRKVTPITISSGGDFTFPAGDIVFSLG